MKRFRGCESDKARRGRTRHGKARLVLAGGPGRGLARPGWHGRQGNAKGNASSKEAIDRISGSGVFARDPDSIITMTRHEVDDAFTVESTLRNFKPVEPFVVRWQFPLMRVDDQLDPSKLKQPKTGRTPIYKVETLLEYLPKQGMSAVKWQKTLMEETGIGRTKFYEFLRELTAEKHVSKDENGIYHKSVR